MEGMERLSLEQEFRQRTFESLVERMSLEQAQEFLVKLHQHMLVQESTFRSILRQQLFD